MQAVKVRHGVFLAAWLLAASSWAQTLPAPSGVLNLTASAQTEVAKDWMSVTFQAVKEGPDAAAVQRQLKQAVEAALAEARKVAKPQQVEVQTGAFSIYPRHNQKTGAISGWQGTAELTVEGKELDTIGQLTGRIAGMNVARVGYGLSREARAKVEAEVSAQAIAKFRAKAAEMAKSFGYSNVAIREVNVTTDEPGFQPVPVMRMQKAEMAADGMALPMEPGKGTVTANVSGSVQMAN